jgi:hypothetical protein|tara:strand:+ start:6934 stop:7734 length:801 start_codon:yes stop_codon:yes gene_type:complete
MVFGRKNEDEESDSKEVAKTVGGDLALDNLERPDYIGTEGKGSEEVKHEDLTIPRIDVFQSLSPQCTDGNPAYDPDAKVGMLFNSLTGEKYGDAIIMVPTYFRKEWLAWRLRKHGGGFRGAYPSEAIAATEIGKMEDAALVEVQETHQQFALIVSQGAEEGRKKVEEVVISCARSKLRPSKQLNSLVLMSGDDRFARMYELGTIRVDGQEGEYQNLTIRQLGFAPEELYIAAERSYEAIVGGTRDVNRDYDDDEPGRPRQEGEAEY